jgi:hypothetical protein
MRRALVVESKFQNNVPQAKVNYNNAEEKEKVKKKYMSLIDDVNT